MKTYMRRTLVLTVNTWSSGTQGLVEPLLERTTSLQLSDGYLDQELWQKIVLDFCHNIHLLKELKWSRPVGFRISMRDDLGTHLCEVVVWDTGPFSKAPSVSVMSAKLMVELIKQAELNGLSGVSQGDDK